MNTQDVFEETSPSAEDKDSVAVSEISSRKKIVHRKKWRIYPWHVWTDSKHDKWNSILNTMYQGQRDNKTL